MSNCSCWVKYPNESYKCKNGKWKCVDNHYCVHDLEAIKNKCGGTYYRKTKCLKIERRYREYDSI